MSIQELQIDADPHPLAYLENKEFEEKIYRAVDSLPAKCRDIFVQYLYHNKTYEEIAITNHISSSTVRVQIKIGLAKLRELLGDLYPLFLLIFKFFRKIIGISLNGISKTCVYNRNRVKNRLLC